MAYVPSYNISVRRWKVIQAGGGVLHFIKSHHYFGVFTQVMCHLVGRRNVHRDLNCNNILGFCNENYVSAHE